jgi:hypothetical protein
LKFFDFEVSLAWTGLDWDLAMRLRKGKSFGRFARSFLTTNVLCKHLLHCNSGKLHTSTRDNTRETSAQHSPQIQTKQYAVSAVMIVGWAEAVGQSRTEKHSSTVQKQQQGPSSTIYDRWGGVDVSRRGLCSTSREL